MRLEFENETFGWEEFDAGGAMIEIERVDEDANADDKALVGRFIGVYLEVDDVQSRYKKSKFADECT